MTRGILVRIPDQGESPFVGSIAAAIHFQASVLPCLTQLPIAPEPYASTAQGSRAAHIAGQKSEFTELIFWLTITGNSQALIADHKAPISLSCRSKRRFVFFFRYIVDDFARTSPFTALGNAFFPQK
jgi:hypothetical protein